MPPRRRARPRRPLPPDTRALLERALSEDKADRDVTTRGLVEGPWPARARIVSEGSGTVSGIAVTEALGRRVGVRVVPRRRDGDAVRPGTTVLEISGDVRRILSVERPMLNLLMHLSGVATATRRAVRAAGPSLAIFGTRKTIPGLRHLEKQAIRDGGGAAHRADLASGILVKSPHVALRGISGAVARLRSAYGRRPIEIEVRSIAEALEAVDAGADALLIDNAGPALSRRIVRAARRRAKRRLWIEISGGLTPETVGRYAATGADAASLGALTHSAAALPFHLRLVAVRAAGSHEARRPRRPR